MSDMAFAPEGDEINIHGTALEPAEPITTEYEAETQQEAAVELSPEPQTNGERVRELVDEANAEERERLQSEVEAVRAERTSALEAVNAYVQQALAQGDLAAVQNAIDVLDHMNDQQAQYEYERQAQVEQDAYETQAML
jgi:hypothetical protein